MSETELTKLKERADMMGISYHPSIGVEKLREKVNAKLQGETEEEKPESESTLSLREERIKEGTKLVRIRLTCMNPAKSEWKGEIISVGNKAIGNVRKFIPFEGYEDGYHVPQIIYNFLKNRKFQRFRTVKTKNGVEVKRAELVNEFAVEVLPPLTEEELAQLRADQRARGE